MVISKNLPNLENSESNEEKTKNNINIELPLDIGDEFLLGSTKYTIGKIAILGDCIFVVNPNVWINIEELQFVRMEGNHRLFKVIS